MNSSLSPEYLFMIYFSRIIKCDRLLQALDNICTYNDYSPTDFIQYLRIRVKFQTLKKEYFLSLFAFLKLFMGDLEGKL